MWLFVVTFYITSLVCLPQYQVGYEVVQPGCHDVVIKVPDEKTCRELAKLNKQNTDLVRDARCEPDDYLGYTTQ